jgi:hypothetical protein
MLRTAHRVVMVRSSQGGSGYRIFDDLVLTAAHVADESGEVKLFNTDNWLPFRRVWHDDDLDLTGLHPSPTSQCRGRLPLLAQAHAGTRGQSDRPPPLASPRCVDHDAKCVCAGQVRFRCAVERAPSTLRPSDPTREHQT